MVPVWRIPMTCSSPDHISVVRPIPPDVELGGHARTIAWFDRRPYVSRRERVASAPVLPGFRNAFSASKARSVNSPERRKASVPRGAVGDEAAGLEDELGAAEAEGGDQAAGLAVEGDELAVLDGAVDDPDLVALLGVADELDLGLVLV